MTYANWCLFWSINLFRQVDTVIANAYRKSLFVKVYLSLGTLIYAESSNVSKHLQSRARSSQTETPCHWVFRQMNKANSIYIPVTWFRLVLMDLAFRVLFHRFQTIYDWIKTELSVATGTNQQMQSNTAVSSFNISKPIKSYSWTNKNIGSHCVLVCA